MATDPAASGIVALYASRMNAVIDAVLVVARDGGDVAEFVSLALASAAAELGSTEALLAGRSGSWEASHVRDLMAGTVGPDDEHLAEHTRGTPTAGPPG